MALSFFAEGSITVFVSTDVTIGFEDVLGVVGYLSNIYVEVF